MVLALSLSACGGATAGMQTAQPGALDPGDFLLEVGAASCPVLQRPARSIEELDAARRDARGAERRQLVRELVTAHLYASEGAEGREARRLRRRAEQLADATMRGSRDSTLVAELSLAELWMSWRAGAANAEARATRFTERHRDAGDLLTLAWMVRGEIALEAERFEDAITSFRFALGQLESPLYGYALLRTAEAERRLGRADEASQALSEVEQLGCAAEPSAFVVRLARAAASQRGSGLRTDPDGVVRPATCPAFREDASEEREWHPEE